MPRGGKREGAGRKPGALTQRTRDIAEGAAQTGNLPLEYMLGVMRNPEATDARRDAMAIAAAPFLHPRLAAIEHKGNPEHPITYQIVSGVPRSEDDPADPDLDAETVCRGQA